VAALNVSIRLNGALPDWSANVLAVTASVPPCTGAVTHEPSGRCTFWKPAGALLGMVVMAPVRGSMMPPPERIDGGVIQFCFWRLAAMSCWPCGEAGSMPPETSVFVKSVRLSLRFISSVM
jgi:hypothetical protein